LDVKQGEEINDDAHISNLAIWVEYTLILEREMQIVGRRALEMSFALDLLNLRYSWDTEMDIFSK
jgi:hypothetical protein